MKVDRSPLRSADVLAQLHADLDRLRSEVVEGWPDLAPEALKRRPAPDKWSAVDCLEHVRKANAMYMGHLERAIARAKRKGRRAVETYTPGFVGERMRVSMAPREPDADGRPRVANKVPTTGGYNPLRQGPPRDPAEVLADFAQQLDRWRALAERLEGVDLNVRSHTLLGPLMQLKLGDVVRYLVAHTDRHLVQAKRASSEPG